VHEFGLLLLPVETQYGEGTMAKLAARLNCSLTFLYRARDFAEAFPTVALLDADIAKKEADGRPVYIRDYYLNSLRNRGEIRLELVEGKVAEAVEAVETLKATTPEVTEEEVASLTAIAQETAQDLSARINEGAVDAYVGWLKQQPCLFCGSVPCDAAHLPRTKAVGGQCLLPVCHGDHMRVHQLGVRKFFEENPAAMEQMFAWSGAVLLAAYSRRGIMI
jgi:hypothetical protein